jgi:hypothetical protein
MRWELLRSIILFSLHPQNRSAEIVKGLTDMSKSQETNNAGQVTITLDGANGSITAGGNGQDGTVVLFDKASTAVVRLDGKNGQVFLSRNGTATIVLDATLANLRLGGSQTAGGDIALYPREVMPDDVQDFNRALIQLDGNHGNIVLRRQKEGPGILFYNPEDSIVLNGQKGDIFLSNADCAEEFDISESEIEPGTVMVLSQEGKLQQSREAYDKKVAGVISGAGECKPGIVLDKKCSQINRMAVALMGKAYCKADAEYSPIEVGDLLTTSPTSGHAMKAGDSLRAFGAVIGKALRPLKTGKGLIPVLIALQ